MKISGRIPVTLHAGCGWLEEMILPYDVECGPMDRLDHAVETKYGQIAAAWHEQTGCQCGCPCWAIFHWDKEERRE